MISTLFQRKNDHVPNNGGRGEANFLKFIAGNSAQSRIILLYNHKFCSKSRIILLLAELFCSKPRKRTSEPRNRLYSRYYYLRSPWSNLRLHDCFCKLVHMDQLACRSNLDTQIYKGSRIQITFTRLFLSFGPCGHKSVRVIWIHGPKSSHVSKFLSHGYFCKLVHTDKIIKIPVIK